jgi:hypothetical protein
LIIFSQGIKCFFHSLERSYLAEGNLTFEIPERLTVFFSKEVTQHSEGHIMLSPPASNIDNFFTRDMVFLPFTRMGPFCTKMIFLALGNPER